MTKTIQQPRKLPATRNLTRGTVVRLSGENGLFFVQTPAEWGGPGYRTITHYHLRKVGGGFVKSVPVASISTASEEEQAAATRQDPASCSQIAAESTARRNARLDDRMRESPEKTLRMARSFMGLSSHQAPDIERMIPLLIPYYRVTHCWNCRKWLDSLEHARCRGCGGLICDCRACFCSQHAYLNKPIWRSFPS